jgi:hypothetical protein
MEDKNLVNHFHHQKLNKFEKKLIHDRTDYPVISLIDALPSEQIKKINDSILYKSEFLPHSCSLQRDWIKNFMYFWGEKNRQDPNEYAGDCMKDFRESTHPLRYRIWFAVHYPDEVEIREDKGDAELTNDFLTEARLEYECACLRKKK